MIFSKLAISIVNSSTGTPNDDSESGLVRKERPESLSHNDNDNDNDNWEREIPVCFILKPYPPKESEAFRAETLSVRFAIPGGFDDNISYTTGEAYGIAALPRHNIQAVSTSPQTLADTDVDMAGTGTGNISNGSDIESGLDESKANITGEKHVDVFIKWAI